jgi:uncharacterized RDD family membrane protein YckC
MKCQGCGHDYPGTLTRCPRCKLKNQERAQSTVLQFPTPPSAQEESKAASLPDWRVELNEKLKEIRAKRSATNNVETVKPRVETRYSEEPKPRVVTSSTAATGARLAPVTSTQSASTSKSSNPVVEAALNRARTASENASRSIGQESTGRSVNSSAVVMGKDATAKALAPEVAPHREENITPGRATRAEEVNDFKTQSTPATVTATRRVVSPPLYEADDLPEMDEGVSTYNAGPPLEIEPRDYLAEEINKLRTQSIQQAAERLPSIGLHFVIGAIDLLVVAVSCAPFVALIRMVSGSLTETGAIVAAGSMGLVISLFYFSLTQSLTGKTFGMMFTGTRLVDAYTQEHPSIGQNILRTIGYLIAVAPAMIGLLWITISSDRRGWQDYISGTLVIRD